MASRSATTSYRSATPLVGGGWQSPTLCDVVLATLLTAGVWFASGLDIVIS